MSMDVETIFRKYGPMVQRRCLHLLRDPGDAADITQEVFLRLLERKEGINAEFPSSLLWNMATNLCLNRIRDRKRHGNSDNTHEDSQSLLEKIACMQDDFATLEARSVLDRIFGKHPESTRTIAVLHLLDGMTLEEVALEVSMSVSGVRKRIRALRTTLHLLEET